MTSWSANEKLTATAVREIWPNERVLTLQIAGKEYSTYSIAGQ
jgi:hypothetical protein